MYVYYVYVSVDFGQWVELIEDYLGIGYGGLVELLGVFVVFDFDWFSCIDMVDSI